ncbi:MAG: helix-turn-helix transcriptional regulator [Tetrasphaera sp.]
MLTEVRAYRLRELRERAGLTQAQVAERIGVGQRQVSKIEHGDLDNAKIGTIRGYLQAVGGDLTIDYVIGDERFSRCVIPTSPTNARPRKVNAAIPAAGDLPFGKVPARRTEQLSRQRGSRSLGW